MLRRALITGISGFAGGFLAEHLLDAGDAVLGTSPQGAWESTSSEVIRDDVKLVAWDFESSAGLPDKERREIEGFGPKVIYHLAGLSVPGDCGTGQPTHRALTVNVQGTGQVLGLAASLGQDVRVVFVSSSHVYAPVDAGAAQVDEDAPLEPKRGYGRTKLEAEKEVRRFLDRGGSDVVIARSFQHTGPRQNARMMLPQWARQFALGGSAPVEVLNCDSVIDLSDVRDVVRAYRLLAEHGRSGQAYNVGSGTARRSGDVLDILRNLADPGRPIRQLQPGFKQDPIADITRLVHATGWRAAIRLSQTVADTLAWWRKQVRSKGGSRSRQ
jgi:GDP-4-dehydro-6-deoxy-D-mannose reductase